MDSPPRHAILRDFENQEYLFTFPKSQESLNEGRKIIAKRYASQANATRSWWRLRRLRSKPINCIRENKIHTATWLKSHDFKGGTLTPWHDKFDDNRYCYKLDLMFLICQFASHNDFFKWSCNFMVGSPSS